MKTLETTTTREERMEIYNKIREDYDKMDHEDWAEHQGWINNIYSGEEHQQGLYTTKKRDFILDKIGIDINDEDFYEEFEEGFDPWSLAQEKNRDWLESLESDKEKYDWVNGEESDWRDELLSIEEIEVFLGDRDIEDLLNDWTPEDIKSLCKGEEWKVEEREMKLCELLGNEWKPSEYLVERYNDKREEDINENMYSVLDLNSDKSLEGIVRDMLFYYCFL